MIPVSIIKRKLDRESPGTIRLHTDDTIPLGWLLCDGGYVYQAQCTRLFAICMNKFGSAPDGMFRLPDMRGRAAIGAISNVGELFGEETHTLSEAEIVAHQHTMKVRAESGSEQLPGSHYIAGSVSDRSSGMPFNKVFSNHTPDGTLHIDTITTTGSAEVNAFALIQPSVGLHFIIKA